MTIAPTRPPPKPPPRAARPAPRPAAPLPGGAASAQVTCCPDVATVEGPRRSSYFGFDPKTDRVARQNADEYWVPPTKAKARPSNRMTRDGARWVSVALGKKTTLAGTFAGQSGVACLGNVRFRIDQPKIARVTTARIVAANDAIVVEGLAEGECTVEMLCNGKTVGYFHVWCKREVTISVDVGTIVTTRTRKASYNVAAIAATLNAIYKQACLKFTVHDVGEIRLTHNLAVLTAESGAYHGPASPAAAGEFRVSASVLTVLGAQARAALMPAPVGGAATGAAAQMMPLRKPGAYAMYFYVPKAPYQPNAGGSVITIGQSPGFVFFDGGAASENSLAHELGHALGLEHPAHNSRRDQFAAHNLSTLNQPVSAGAATNTEPAYGAAGAAANVMAADPLNLMGYWTDKPVRKPLRYHQWINCKRS